MPDRHPPAQWPLRSSATSPTRSSLLDLATQATAVLSRTSITQSSATTSLGKRRSGLAHPSIRAGTHHCQIGQLVVIDSTTDGLLAEIPILLTGPDCKDKLPAYASGAGPDHNKITKDGTTLFVTT